MEKPATLKCLNCEGIDGDFKRFCYNCDNEYHVNKCDHIKQLIPYS